MLVRKRETATGSEGVPLGELAMYADEDEYPDPMVEADPEEADYVLEDEALPEDDDRRA